MLRTGVSRFIMMLRKTLPYAALLLALAALLSSNAYGKKKKYDNPINKDTQQPDKVLFDLAIQDIEHSRFEKARLLLQTMMNTYDNSEYLAKAKLAVADSWYREGGAHGFAQAEAEYKDFILFYPTMEEAAEAQEKICKMQYQQMEKADRDPVHALRAEDECRQLLVQFPNSKFAPEAQQMMRNSQEVLADAEFKVGTFYHHKGSMPAAANRLEGVSNQFPLYSQADEALWELADSYRRMGDRFEDQQADTYAKIVKDYPLSIHADAAKALLQQMKRPVPEADPAAMARMKYDQENKGKRSLLAKAWGPFGSRPDTTMAAKSGSPPMTGFRPTVPKSVPQVAAGTQGVTDVTATQPSENVLDKAPDARANPPGANGAAGATGTAAGGSAGGSPTVPQSQPLKPVAITRTGIDLNMAPESEIAKLPGINKLMAKRIVLMRPYLSVNDLIKTGVSKKVLDKLKPLPADAPPAVKKAAAKASTK
jgi:outer membrane protein assembly factor BamD